MRTLLTSVLLVAGLATSAASQKLYVDVNNATPGNGTSWTTAFTDLQPALAAATPGTTIWVAAGFYTATPYAIPAGVTVKGRYLTGYTTDLERQVNNQTVLFAGGNSRVVSMGAGSVIDGLGLQSGQAPAPGGGGALIDGVGCTIRSCFFILNNDSAGAGAAVLVRNGANPRIEDCVFYLNGDDNSGATIEVDNASGTYVNLTIDVGEQSGFRFKNGATPKIYNSIFSGHGTLSGNPGRVARGIEQLDTGSNPTLSHNLFFNNKTSLYLHGATELTTVAQVNALSFASNNLEGDPQYVIPVAVYQTKLTSPCIDAGLKTVRQTTQGIYDNGRVVDGNLDGFSNIDIGAYEYADCTLRIPVDVHQHVHLAAKSASSRPVSLILSAAPSPAPFVLEPFGVIFIDLSFVVVFPNPPQNVITYSPGVAKGIYLYFQAFTIDFVNGGFNLSNPAIHVTN